MYGSNTWHTGQVVKKTEASDEYQFVITFPVNLGVGSYSIVTALHDKDTHLTTNYEWQDMALMFNVINFDKTLFSGCNWLNANIKVEKL